MVRVIQKSLTLLTAYDDAHIVLTLCSLVAISACVMQKSIYHQETDKGRAILAIETLRRWYNEDSGL